MMQKRSVLAIIFIATFISCKAQTRSTQTLNECNCVYNLNYETNLCDTANISPSYKGGVSQLFKFIQENTDSSIAIRPLKRTKVNFIIVADGKIDSIEIENKKVEDYTISEKQLLTAIKKSENNWIAGQCDNKKVAARFKMSFNISTR